MPTLDIDVSFGDVQVLNIPGTGADVPLVPGPCWLVGWSMIEATGAATAQFAFKTGQTFAGGASLAAGGSDSHNIGSEGAYIPQGLLLHVYAGQVFGCVYYRIPS